MCTGHGTCLGLQRRKNRLLHSIHDIDCLSPPFGLTNAPANFHKFYTAYLDDILIYSDTFYEYQIHIKQVLEALSKTGLHMKPGKCELHKTEVVYLDMIISAEDVKMEPKKIVAVGS